MAYSDFSLQDVVTEFDLVEDRTKLFDNVETLEMSEWLQETFAVSLDFALSTPSEKAKSEFIVAPILLELGKRNHGRFGVHSGKRLNVLPEKGLHGECDFIFTKGKITHTIQTPIFALVEGKKDDIEPGLGQCAAQMIGAKIFNQNKGNDIEIIFGCVTTGEAWQFLKLDHDTILLERNRYYLDNVGQILGMLQNIVDFYV